MHALFNKARSLIPELRANLFLKSDIDLNKTLKHAQSLSHNFLSHKIFLLLARKTTDGG